MKKVLRVSLAILAISFSASSAFAKCEYSEGDDIAMNGGRSNEGHCKAYGNIEVVNKGCTKVKISISKVTNIFGMSSGATCSFQGLTATAGEVPFWISPDVLQNLK